VALRYVLARTPDLEQPEALKFPALCKYLATVVQVCCLLMQFYLFLFYLGETHVNRLYGQTQSLSVYI
jgi:hypothetical protein